MNQSIVIRSVAGGLTAFVLLALGDQAAVAQPTTGSAKFGPIEILGDEPSYLDFGAGAFDIQGHRESGTNPEGRIEFRYGRKLFFIGPAVGLLADDKGAIFGYGGFYSDIAVWRFVVTPFAGLGGYHRGGSEDLGGTFQFRLSVNVAYQFDNKSRLGVQFAHISNAGIHDRNPGDNEMLLTRHSARHSLLTKSPPAAAAMA